MVTHSCIPRPTLVTDFLNDLYRFSPTSNAWTALSVASPPSARYGMGFAATPDGMLYVFGGSGTGSRGEGRVWI
jgi:N-acetylneuraminic acid mutarotase